MNSRHGAEHHVSPAARARVMQWTAKAAARWRAEQANAQAHPTPFPEMAEWIARAAV